MHDQKAISNFIDNKKSSMSDIIVILLAFYTNKSLYP